jgi:hypothetical protein
MLKQVLTTGVYCLIPGLIPLGKYGGQFLFQCNYDLKYLKLDHSRQPLFYKDNLHVWQDIYSKEPENASEYINEML